MGPREVTTDRNRRCARCGAAVTRQFIRVFGSGDAVDGCLECLTRTELALGQAADSPAADAGVPWPSHETR